MAGSIAGEGIGFGDVSHRGLTPFDVASPYDVPAYPLPEAERYTVAQWADIRSVTEDAVCSSVNAAREKLLAEEDRGPNGESP